MQVKLIFFYVYVCLHLYMLRKQSILQVKYLK